MKLFRNSDFGTQKKSDIQNRLSLKPFCYIFGLPCMLNLWVSLKCTLSTLSISICEFSHSLIFKQSRRLGKLSTLWGNTELLVEWSNFQVLDMYHKVSVTDWPSLGCGKTHRGSCLNKSKHIMLEATQLIVHRNRLIKTLSSDSDDFNFLNEKLSFCLPGAPCCDQKLLFSCRDL